METKELVNKKWENFKNEIKHNNRYFSGNEIVEILDRFPREPAMRVVSPNLRYRARIGDWTNSADSEMLAPEDKKATEGRCNPAGISYLYVTSSIDAAIKEVRPKCTDKVTVANIIIDNLRIFSFGICRHDEIIKRLGVEDEELLCLIEIINEELSLQINDDDKFDYIPIQFIAEYTKFKGYDGFSYKSSLANGVNFVIFNWRDEYKIKVGAKKLYKCVGGLEENK